MYVPRGERKKGDRVKNKRRCSVCGFHGKIPEWKWNFAKREIERLTERERHFWD